MTKPRAASNGQDKSPPWVEITAEILPYSDYSRMSNEELIMRGYEIDFDNRLDADYYTMKEEDENGSIQL